MRIAFIGQKGVPACFGGIERHVEELGKKLVQADFDVFVYSRPWYNDCYEHGKYHDMQVINLPSIRTKHLDAISHTFIAIMHALTMKYDIIHFHGVGPALLAWIPKLFMPKTKVIVTFHCIDRLHQKWGRLAKFCLGLGERFSCVFADETIVVSKVLRLYCLDKYKKFVTYIPNGINKAKPVTDFAELEQFNIQPNKYIVMVARLIKHKGAHHLIKAWQALEQAGAVQDKKLVIVGDDNLNSFYVQDLKQSCQNSNSVIMTGFASGKTLQQLFAGSLFVVHPSESEGLAISILEAMSMGKSVLASDIPENMALVQQYGFNFKNKDIAALAKKIAYLLNNPDQCQSKGCLAAQHVNKEYNWTAIVAKTADVYQRVWQVQVPAIMPEPKTAWSKLMSFFM